MRFTIFILLTFSVFGVNAQQTINGTIMHDALEREYILYVPATYVPGTPAPLVFNFHGYTSNAEQQMLYGDFRSIADTAGFLLVHPNGTLDNTGTMHWNSGWGTGVDDVGFTSALIDSLAADHSVDLSRVYSTGMSNGGFMSYHLACELSHRIAAIASVTGTMTILGPSTCGASHPTPVMQIHGTADPTVPYDGNATMTPIPATILHWVNYNGCSPDPIVTDVLNVNVIDGCTAEHLLYPGGNNGVEVEHYKILGGGHSWPGAIIPIGVTNYDFDASEVIWQFFAQYDINGVVGIEEDENELGFGLYPNPGSDELNIRLGQLGSESFDLSVFNSLGQRILFETSVSGNLKIDTREWKPGAYSVRVDSGSGQASRIFIKR